MTHNPSINLNKITLVRCLGADLKIYKPFWALPGAKFIQDVVLLLDVHHSGSEKY